MSSLIESIFGRSITARQLAIIGVGIAVTAAVFFGTQWSNAPVMTPLFADVPIASVGPMVDKLTELGIPYTLDRNGNTLRVAETDVAKARVALARENLPNAGRPGMELFDKPTWGMTDFTQKVNYGRALEGELERTISNMRDVQQVQVHLALEDEALFKQNERPSKASVTLTMKGGGQPPQSVVTGIASLVAASIGGLEPQRVTIVDESGKTLTSNDDSVAGLTSRQLAVQREVETSLEKKAQELLGNFVGDGNSHVTVSASMNFDKLERTTQSVDPDKQAATSEQKAEVTPGKPEQGAGYNTTATSYENSRSVENYTGAIGNIRKLTVAVLIADKVEIPVADSAAKTPPKPIITPRSAEEISKIESLVRNGLGVDSARGDMISVVATTFDVPKVLAKHDVIPTQSFVNKLQANPKPIMT
ncbi:MAG: flagellar basal-body MS-ring/collar protein FliF, partial [Gemmatimonadaceae bacterium]